MEQIWEALAPRGFDVWTPIAKQLFPEGGIDNFEFSVETTPFVSWGWPVLSVIAYAIVYIFLKAIFGTQRRGEPATAASKSSLLFVIALIHNVILVALSAAMGIGIFDAAWRLAQEHGAWELICATSATGTNLIRGRIGFWLYVYYLSKYYEMIDTVILLVKSKPVLTLHLYHHATMVFTAWAWVHYGWIEGSAWCVFVNSIVHFFMYIYYTLALFNIQVWWKKFLTLGQIIQFWTGFFYVQAYMMNAVEIVSYWPFEWKRGPCGGHLGPAIESHALNFSFIVLFIRFYVSSYLSGRKDKKGGSGNKKKKQ